MQVKRVRKQVETSLGNTLDLYAILVMAPSSKQNKENVGHLLVGGGGKCPARVTPLVDVASGKATFLAACFLIKRLHCCVA